MIEKIKKAKKDKKKILLIVGLVSAIIVANSIIYLVTPIESKIIYTNWILLINSSIAAGLSVILVGIEFLKQKVLNRHIKIHIALATGLLLWLCANIQWFIYESEGVVPDIPSTADILWIIAYPFLGYAVYSTFKEFYKKHQNKHAFFASLSCGILLITYIAYITINLSVLSSSIGIILFSILIVYPILNIILIVPAISMFIGFKKEPELSVPRMLESLSLINLVIADSWFVIIYLSNKIAAIWYSNLLIVDHYLIISAGLLWSLIVLHASQHKYSSKLKNWVNFRYKIPQVALLIPILVVIPFFVNSFYEKIGSNSNIIDNNQKIKIGALLGLSGSSYESGITQKSVLSKALDDINRNFSRSNIHKTVQLDLKDTEIKPEVAVARVKNLIDDGVKIIIGPQTSGELKKINNTAGLRNMIFISQSSTAPSLSKDDNIFRLLQNDTNQAQKIAEKMRSDGVEIVIPILRDDQYGNELHDITKAKFEDRYHHFSKPIKYDPHVGEFAGSLHRINFIVWDQKLKDLNSAVHLAAASEKSYSKVGVYVISFGELVPLLIQAPSHNELFKVNWYGSEATAKNERLLKHQRAAEFAYKTNFTSPLLAINETNKEFKLLENATRLKLNRPDLKLNPNDANTYDALWIAALTANVSGSTNVDDLKNNVYKIINSYKGASGNIKFDRYGDRIGNYDLWEIKQNVVTKNYEWEKK
jgi:ABC-type branched-subunit amino acid transport system substrate-binding protein